MTKDQTQMVLEAIKSIKESVSVLSDRMNEQSVRLENLKREVKSEPFQLEGRISDIVSLNLSKAMSDALFRSVLIQQLVDGVISDNYGIISEVVRGAMLGVVSDEEFRVELRRAFSHKLAKLFISGQDSGIEKVFNQLNGDPIFRSRLTLVISSLVEEYGGGGK